MGKALLSEVVGSQSFSLQDGKFSTIHNLDDLLSLAIEFETDKVMFYQLMQPFTEDRETLDFFDSIITQENQHIERLQLYLDADVEESTIVSESLCY